MPTISARITLVLALTVAIAAVPGPARAESTAQEVAYGVGSATTTLMYAPVKASFCTLGAVSRGLTLPFGGPRTAGKVASTAYGGTWVVTPAALRVREPLRFVGGGR